MHRIGFISKTMVSVLLGCFLLVFWPTRPLAAAGAFVERTAQGRPQLVIDPGHGGEDGGAISLTGVPESEINLSISLKMDCILGLFGTQSILLRTSDISLHDPGSDTLRSKKASDLRNRALLIEKTENAVLISIHQNSYQDVSYHGAQVFYRDETSSLPFAQNTQLLLRKALDPKNPRTSVKIPKNIFLMNHISCPAILVECGFLSNREEAEMLCTEHYQRKIAAVLSAAWRQYESCEREDQSIA